MKSPARHYIAEIILTDGRSCAREVAALTIGEAGLKAKKLMRREFGPKAKMREMTIKRIPSNAD